MYSNPSLVFIANPLHSMSGTAPFGKAFNALVTMLHCVRPPTSPLAEIVIGAVTWSSPKTSKNLTAYCPDNVFATDDLNRTVV